MTENEARRVALDLLSRREHSALELHRKLAKKSFPADIIIPVLNRLSEEKLLSNERFAECYTRSRRNKGYGPLRIRLELRERGITDEMIEQQLNLVDNAWAQQAKSVWRKRFKGIIPQDRKALAQQMRFLHYRGFASDHLTFIFESEDACELTLDP